MPDFARDAEGSRSAKLALRHRVMTARQALPEAVRRSAAASIQATTVAWLRARRPTRCAAYVPVGTEPGGPGLVEALAGAGAGPLTLLLPVLLPDGDLDWAAYDGTLRRASRGLLEPAGPTLGPAAVADVDLILVPALAVSRSGMRLGRGGGSYDRALARATRAVKVALLHDGELYDEVPAEPHDQRVDAVITPTGGLTPTPGDRPTIAPDWTK
jgi:5-formyltetrahydrofolate cyclo-ligase